MLCSLSVYSKTVQLHTCLHSLFFRFWFRIGYGKVLSGVPYAAQEAPAGGLVLYADPRLLLIPPLYIPLPVTTGGLRSRRNSRVAVPYADLKLLLILPLCFPFGNHKFISVCESVSLL